MEKRQRGEIVKLNIVDMSDSGAGIGKDDGFAVFVPGAVTGDVVTAELTKVKKPKTLLIYGGMVDAEYGDAELVEFSNKVVEKMKNGR